MQLFFYLPNYGKIVEVLRSINKINGGKWALGHSLPMPVFDSWIIWLRLWYHPTHPVMESSSFKANREVVLTADIKNQ